PNFFLIAGPNGAGKSTSAPEILTGVRRVAEFVNVDVIQKERSVSEIEAGRITLARLDELGAARKDMAFETTLASQGLVPRIRRLQAAGYRFHLFFFWLPSADMAVERVAARVKSGGHHIPEETIRRRYERGLENFFNGYFRIADSWILYNNTRAPAIPVASQAFGEALAVEDNQLWNRLVNRYMKPKAEEPQAATAVQQSWTVDEITDAVNRAVTAALKRHKERGESVVIWRDGKIVWLKPEEIEV
ncbi:MAG TPA: zeta toxin family protein, partial [Burkholderiales bacterium]|nr:zeta toxin family protein [Burkholderiales bacterium]